MCKVADRLNISLYYSLYCKRGNVKWNMILGWLKR